MPDMQERLIAGAVIALALASCGGGGGDAPVCENPRAVTTVAMGDFFYEPGCVESAAGAELEIVNEGNSPHTFTVEADASAEVDLSAGERATLTVPELSAGTYPVTCSYHPQMEGALRVSG
jgi:plastocyanin